MDAFEYNRIDKEIVDKLLTNEWKKECENMRKLANFGLGMLSSIISDFIKDHPQNERNIFLASEMVVAAYVFAIIKNNKEDITKSETCMQSLLGPEGLKVLKKRIGELI